MKLLQTVQRVGAAGVLSSPRGGGMQEGDRLAGRPSEFVSLKVTFHEAK